VNPASRTGHPLREGPVTRPRRSPPRHGRRAPHGRRRLAAAIACLAVVAVAAWVARTAGAHGHPVARPVTGRLARTVHPAPAVPLVLQVTPAPYQLPSAISRAVVLAGSGPGLLLAGGLTSRPASTSAVLRLDPVTGQTRPAGRLSVATHDAGGAVIAGRAFVFGGGSASSIATVQAAVTDAAWPVAGQLPRVRSDLGAVTVGGRAYLVGGYDGSSYDASVLATSDGRGFTVAARLPVPVRYPAVAALGSRIWVFGGQTPSGLTNVIQQVDTATGKATVAGRLPTPLAHAAGFTLGGRLYVAGGQTTLTAAHPSGQVLQYTPGSGRVPSRTSVAGQLPVPVANGAAAVLGSTGYLVGGDQGGTGVPSVTTFRLVRPAAVLPAAAAPWLAPAHGPGHLRPGSDPSALPGDILIADHLNNRLLIVDPQGRIRWMFPRPGDLARGQSFLVPDDAFFSPDGKDIIATEEDNFVISVIGIASHRITYRYGRPGVPGAGPDRLDNPDDAMIAPNGRIVTADIKNCRLLTIAPPAHRPLRIIGQTTNLCMHAPPHRFGSPNGAFPLTDGRYLITEINGDWADEMSLTGRVSWSTRPPGVAYPSDSNEVYPGRYLTADYSDPGQVVEFTPAGRRLWRFGGLNKPSLAVPLPNGDVLVNDDYNDRVIVIDPATNRIVWQYGHTGVPGTAPGYLHDPDGVDPAPPDSLLITHSATMGLPG
jgi:hypothetical protein